MLTTLTIIISLIVGVILGRSSIKMPPVVPNLDAPRLDYLETTKQSAFYNDQAQAWAVLSKAAPWGRAASSNASSWSRLRSLFTERTPCTWTLVPARSSSETR